MGWCEDHSNQAGPPGPRAAAQASRRSMMSPQALANPDQARRAPALVSVNGRGYPLRSALLRGRAEGGLAQTTLVQEFSNPYDEPLEVLYTMPLPVDGAVLGYTIRMGDRVIRGEIALRHTAEKKYREAL